MKRLVSILFILSSSFFIAHAQPSGNLLQDTSWTAVGNHHNESLGFIGLDTIGYVNDTIIHALSIGADGGAIYALNRTPLSPDTARQYKFPGQKVIRCNLNGDAYPDFVCWDATQAHQKITFLYGTDTFNVFDTALTILADPAHDEFTSVSIAVADVNLSGYGSVFISDRDYNNSSSGNSSGRVGRLLFYKGGATLDSTPTEIVYGESKVDYVGGTLAVGHIRDTHTLSLIETRVYGDSIVPYLYPFKRDFQLSPTDTVICRLDSIGALTGFALADIYGDSIDDILLGGTLGIVNAYRGGQNISPYPTFKFHEPFPLSSPAYGSVILDVGDVCGFGYHSLLVTDPQALIGNVGGVYLYNIGKGLKDTCFVYAFGGVSSGPYFGSQVVRIGKYASQTRNSFMVGGDEDFITNHAGQLVLFHGDSSWKTVGVKESVTPPVVFTLDQNYPNPFSGDTHIAFSVLDSRLYGLQITITLYDEFGKRVATLYRGAADNVIRALHFNAEGLPSGNYFYRLACGGREETRMMSVMK